MKLKLQVLLLLLLLLMLLLLLLLLVFTAASDDFHVASGSRLLPYSPAAAMLLKGVACSARDSDGHDGLSVALRRRLPRLQVAGCGCVPVDLCDCNANCSCC